MGCTLVAGVVEDNILYVANVGDSRLYLIHGSLIHQVTRDHSYVEEMVAMGQMERDSERLQQAARTSLPGPWASAETVEHGLSLRWIWSRGIIFLLCSDGLTNMVEDRDICRIVTGPGSHEGKGLRPDCGGQPPAAGMTTLRWCW